jgi:hypothetical protein
MLVADKFQNGPRIGGCFFGRKGGVSQGIFASLNCGPGSGDSREAVIENRRIALESLGGGQGATLVTLYQIHSAKSVSVAMPWKLGEAPQADAMATNVPGIALGILTADCAPVLFSDAETGVIGAAHAGWKGALGGVIESALCAMEQLSAKRQRIAATIGPCISQENYEVGADFRDRFVEADTANARYFVAAARPGHWRFDLEAYVALRLAQASVGNITRLCACTYADESRFFSFRRATHRSEADYGRQLSAIMLSP